MEIASGQSLWVLPPHFGLWIPARTEHTIRMPEQVSMRTLYLRSGIHQSWTTCTVFHVTPLLRELIFEIVRVGRIRTRNPLECAFRDILVSQLMNASPVPTGVALPREPRVLSIAETVLRDPSHWRPLAALSRQEGVSVRTVQRIFRREVGLDFESWRRQVRLMKGIRLLVSGLSVKEVSHAVGYQDSSTFVALFRSTFGSTPRSWISERVS
jgi:AraC-like DNA-binding protein